MKWVKKILQYFGGLLLLAIGTNIAKMSGLGISPVGSIPRALEVIFGLSLGTMVIVVYCFLIVLQILVLRKKFILKNVLGIPIAIIFGYMVDLVGIDPNAFGHLLVDFPRPDGYLMQLLYLLVSIIMIGFGVSLYLRPKLIPMPAEGLAMAMSDTLKKKFGNCKTAVDVSLISIALILQLVFLGGLESFTGPNVVVREGTILSAILVGQCVKVITKYVFVKKKKKNEDVE